MSTRTCTSVRCRYMYVHVYSDLKITFLTFNRASDEMYTISAVSISGASTPGGGCIWDTRVNIVHESGLLLEYSMCL